MLALAACGSSAASNESAGQKDSTAQESEEKLFGARVSFYETVPLEMVAITPGLQNVQTVFQTVATEKPDSAALADIKAKLSAQDMDFVILDPEQGMYGVTVYRKQPLLEDDAMMSPPSTRIEEGSEFDEVQLHLTDNGGKEFSRITKMYAGQPLAIAINGEVVNAPMVNCQIDGGNISVLLPPGKGKEYYPQQR